MIYEGAKRLPEFANEIGVSSRTVQNYVKKHKDEIAGEIEWQGTEGTWLSVAAQEFLTEKICKNRRQDFIAVYNGEPHTAVQALQENVATLQTQLAERDALIADYLAASAKLQATVAELIAKRDELEGKVHLLEDGSAKREGEITLQIEQAEAKVKEAEERAEQSESKLKDSEEYAARLESDIAAERKTSEAYQALADERESRLAEVKETKQAELEALQQQLDEAHEREKKLKERNWWERLTRAGE